MLCANKHDFLVLGVWSMWKYPSKYARKCHGFPRARLPFLTHNMARPPKIFLPQIFVAAPRKICGKSCGATLSGRTLFLSIEARFRVRGLFLPHIMAAHTWRPHRGKKGKRETIARIPGCFRQHVPHVRCGGFGGALPLGLLATCPAPSVR